MTRERTMGDLTAQHYANRLTNLAAAIRELADRVEREGQPRPSAAFDGTPRFTNAASHAVHALTWGIANLNIDGLISDAGQADRAELQDGAE